MNKIDDEDDCQSCLRRLQSAYANNTACLKYVTKPDFDLGPIHKIYDGDSITLMCDISGNICLLQTRLLGAGAPEIKQKTITWQQQRSVTF